jgi:hypothetical protein
VATGVDLEIGAMVGRSDAGSLIADAIGLIPPPEHLLSEFLFTNHLKFESIYLPLSLLDYPWRMNSRLYSTKSA